MLDMELSMSAAELRVKTDDQYQQVVIELWENEQLVGVASMDADSAERHLREVGKRRAQLIDPVPANIGPGIRVDVLAEPVWQAPINEYSSGRGLCIRHPGFGWLGLLFSYKQAAAIAEHLSRDFQPVEVAE
jgi:hypothetical protein